MRFIIIVLFIYVAKCYAQDKIILKNGKVILANVYSINKVNVLFSDTNLYDKLKSINTNSLVLIESKSGVIHYFYNDDNALKTKQIKKNHLGCIFSDLLLFRTSISYERRFGENIGIMIPLGLDFSGELLSQFNLISTGRRTNKLPYAIGLDFNYYLNNSNFYFGSRLRYGYLLFSNQYIVTSFQFQVGRTFSAKSEYTIQHFSLGFGGLHYRFLMNRREFFPSLSFNYRLSVKW
jgi:hypothetical protein